MNPDEIDVIENLICNNLRVELEKEKEYGLEDDFTGTTVRAKLLFKDIVISESQIFVQHQD